MDEKSCLNYLAEFYHFLAKKEKNLKQHKTDDILTEDPTFYQRDSNNGAPKHSMLRVSRQQWLEFYSATSTNSLMNENEIEALWSLFSTIVIVEGLSVLIKPKDIREGTEPFAAQSSNPSDILSEPSHETPTKETCDSTHDQKSCLFDPHHVYLDFRHFSLLLFLQVSE